MCRHLQTDFFQTRCDDRDHYALHYNISLDDLDHHSRSQSYEISKAWVFIFFKSILMKLCMLPQPVGLLKIMLNLFCTSNSLFKGENSADMIL